MHTLSVSRKFNISKSTLWEIYTTYDHWNKWAGFSTSKMHKDGSETKYGTGAVRCLGSMGINAYEEIFEFEPKNRFTYTVLRGGLPMKSHLGEVVFHEENNTTELTWNCQFEAPIPFLGIFMKPFITIIFKRALKGLANYIKKNNIQ